MNDKTDHHDLASRPDDVPPGKHYMAVLDRTGDTKIIFEQHGYFDVQIADGRRFRIKKGWSHNVFELNAEGKPLRSLCAHSREAVPEFDNMLAQKLWLEVDPDRFLGVANKGPLLIN